MVRTMPIRYAGTSTGRQDLTACRTGPHRGAVAGAVDRTYLAHALIGTSHYRPGPDVAYPPCRCDDGRADLFGVYRSTVCPVQRFGPRSSTAQTR